MADPISTVIVAGAVGGFAGKFIEKAWDSGEKWLAEYFKGHGEALQARAEDNSREFLRMLADKVAKLEEDSTVTKAVLDQAQEDPSFGALLQKALIGSAQTDSKEKHELLSRLVSERLTKPSESIISLASQSACDAMTHLTVNQLHILGFVTTITLVHPSILNKGGFASREAFVVVINLWIKARFSPYMNLNVSALDILHLEALSCVRSLGIAIMDLEKVLKQNLTCGDFVFTSEDLKKTDVGEKMAMLWNEKGLRSTTPTSIGQLIGVYVTDLLSNSKTSMDGWM